MRRRVEKRRFPDVRYTDAIREMLREGAAEHTRDLSRSLGVFVRLDPSVPYRGAVVVAADGGYAFEVPVLDLGRILRRT